MQGIFSLWNRGDWNNFDILYANRVTCLFSFSLMSMILSAALVLQPNNENWNGQICLNTKPNISFRFDLNLKTLRHYVTNCKCPMALRFIPAFDKRPFYMICLLEILNAAHLFHIQSNWLAIGFALAPKKSGLMYQTPF